MSDLGQTTAVDARRTRLRVAAIVLVVGATLAAWNWLGSRASPPGQAPVSVAARPVAVQPPGKFLPETVNAAPDTVAGVAPNRVESLPPAASVPSASVLAVPEAATAAAAIEAPTFDVVRVTPRGETVLAGHAAPDAMVAISAGGHVVAQAHADGQGQWVALPDASLPVGPSELTVSARSGGTLPAVAGGAPLLVIVPEPAGAPVAPAASATALPTVPTTASPPASTALAMLLPGDAPPRLLQKPTAGSPTAAVPGTPVQTALNLDQVDYPTAGAIRFAGTAHPDATIRLYVDDVAFGEARADALGRWSMTPTDAIASGPHRVRVDELGIRGQVVARVALPFERSELAPGDVLAGRVVVQPHQNLWRIARRAYGQGIRYTVIYQANREQISDPARIYPGQVFTIPGVARPIGAP